VGIVIARIVPHFLLTSIRTEDEATVLPPIRLHVALLRKPEFEKSIVV
jgi:hypothetical protein